MDYFGPLLAVFPGKWRVNSYPLDALPKGLPGAAQGLGVWRDGSGEEHMGTSDVDGIVSQQWQGKLVQLCGR